MQRSTLLLFVFLFCAWSPKQNIELIIVIQNVWVVDVKKGSLENRTKDIHIRQDKIIKIENHQKKSEGENRRVIDGSGKFVIPGL